MNIFKRAEFWIGVIVIIAGIIYGVLKYHNIPTRIDKAEERIIEIEKIDIRQTAIQENLVKNQERLIRLQEN